MKIYRMILFTLISLFISSSFAMALSVKSLTLEQLVALSDVVAKAQVVDRKVEVDAYETGYMVTYYTFKVDECLVGECESQMVVKQLAKGLPEYEVGQTYLVFYPEASEETGLVAPVGIWQGQMKMEKENGKWVVPQLQKNARLRSSVQALSKAATTSLSDYETFKAVIQQISQE